MNHVLKKVRMKGNNLQCDWIVRAKGLAECYVVHEVRIRAKECGGRGECSVR